jgi:hypothetical protein
MKTRKTKSELALIQMVTMLLLVLGLLAAIALWNREMVEKIYFADRKTIVLNGFIFLMFITGVIYLIRAYAHCRAEERHLERFISDTQRGEFAPENLPARSLIARRYDTIKNLYDRGVPIDHGAIAAIMVAEESLYQSYPKFVNNVLILTGVFGTVVSLIFALVGAGSVLANALPGEGIGVMLLGMNTALTTTATAIVCFFLFTYFYQRFNDIQTYLFSKLEEAVLVYIIPEFAFDSDALNYKTERLIKELGAVVAELKKGTDFIQASLADLNRFHDDSNRRLDVLIARQDSQLEKADAVADRLETVKAVLEDGFRLKS